MNGSRVVEEFEKQRTENLKNLGYMCFNSLVGKQNEAAPEFVNKMYEIKGCFNRIELLRRTGASGAEVKKYLDMLDEKAVEMGCMSYNSYIDRKTEDKGILEYCVIISDLNKRIVDENKILKENENMDGLLRSAVYQPDSEVVHNGAQELFAQKNTPPFGMESVQRLGGGSTPPYERESVSKFGGERTSPFEIENVSNSGGGSTPPYERGNASNLGGGSTPPYERGNASNLGGGSTPPYERKNASNLDGGSTPPYERKNASNLGGGSTPPFERESVSDFADENKIGTEKMKVNYPYGMEPIPMNAKICVCGYRNREYAKYCGKCGAKI